MAETRVHHRTCNLCEAMCGLRIEVEGDAIRSIRGDPDDPFSKGFLCPKATALEDVHLDPDRKKHPLRRTGEGWTPIGWDEAFDEVANRIAEIQARHGPDSVAIYLGNPNVHSLGALTHGLPFIRALRTHNRYSATSVDQLPHHLAATTMFGHMLLLPVPDIDRTQFFLALGANPLASNGSMMTAPGMPLRLKALKARGGRLVVVDPRRTETAEVADRHFFIRPSTDALLLAALVHTILEEKLERLGRLADFTDGLEQVRAAVAPFAPERIAGPTGIPAEQIRTLARDFARAESAAAYGRVGLSTQAYGAVAQWLIQVLNALTGNLDRPGGVLLTRPAVNPLGLTPRGGYARHRTRVRKLPSFGGEFPVAALAEEILTEGPGRIRALVVVGGNPVLSTPNGAQLERALGTLDLLVAVDPYLNETTRHAHVLLPPTTALEREHYDVVFHLLAVRNTTKWSPPLFPPAPGAKHDWEIFQALTRRLRTRGPRRLLRPLRAVVDRLATPRRLIDLALRTGPYGLRSPHRLSVGKLEKRPHGVDLGPLESSMPERLMTPGKRIQLAPELLVRDLARVGSELLASPPARNGELLLIGRRDLRSNNSWMHNSQRLVKGPERCTLLMHPDDARARGLSAGQTVDVRSRVGSVPVRLELTEAVMPGVVSLPHGWGHGRPGVQLRVATTHPGVSLNDLTDDRAVDTLLGTAAFSGTPVHVTATRAG
ncbi:MAG TPA: molybdopterin oxidoreductase family protein [Myxococcaceae bacterium]|nr:molybdopterin oxidoreductase family protein [Myxococcaceae bacterium]